MHDLTSGMFEQLGMTSFMEVEQRIAYTQRILRGAAFKKYKAVRIECKYIAKDLAGDKWNLGNLRVIFTELFWTWDKSDGLDNNKDAYLGLDMCVEF